MTVSYPRSLPATPGIRSNTFGIQTNEDEFRSPVTQKAKYNTRPGARWVGVFTMPPMTNTTAATWEAWFISLRGRVMTFLAGDPDRTTPIGIADTGSDTPLCNGVVTVGATTVSTKGWRISGTGLLVPGDNIQVGTGANSELKKVIETFNSDGSGNGTITVEPPFRIAHAGDTAIAFENPVGVFRLAESVRWESNEAKVHGFSFALEEAI